MPYIVTPPKPVSQERFLDMLNVLPPCKWHRGDYAESFFVSERLSGNLVSWFVRLGTDHYELVDDATTSNFAIESACQKLKESQDA